MSENKSMIKDTIIYMFAKIIEGLVGIITVALYTNYFIPEEYGIINIVNLTIVTSAMIFMSWLSQSAMRYINEYIKEQSNFYSTIFVIWLKINILIVGITSIIIFYYTNFINNKISFILWLSLIMFITYGTNLLSINVLVVKRRIKLNLSLSLGFTILKLVTTLILINLFNAKIEWILIPNIIFDLISTLIIIVKLDIIKYISFSNYSKDVVNKFIKYGVPIIGLTISTSILYNADRYIIQFLINSAAVGIYYANYSLISSAFSMLSNAIMKGSYPSILNEWNNGNKEQTIKLISQAVRHYLLISIPAIIYVIVLAESVANLILDIEYVEGYKVMKWVAIGMTFLGLTEYSNKYFELSINTKAIFKYSLLSGMVNIISNIILIPIFGYQIASITTAIGFFIYFLLSFLKSKNYFKWTIMPVTYFRILLSAVLMGIISRFILNNINLSLFSLGIVVILGGLIYILFLFITGELNSEIKLLKEFIKYKK